MKQYAVYLRVSTQRQGAQGLGISAQRNMCENFIRQNKGKQVQEFMDVESGTHRDRKGLWQAIDYCKKNGCSLVIAKLDRMSRDVEFTFKVINTGIDIHFTDMPVVNSMILGVFAAVAQYEREMVSTRTKQALAALKARGDVKLGAANEKFQANRANKDKEVLLKQYNKMGNTKRTRFQESLRVRTFLRILQQVFPDATTNEDPHKWEWKLITTKGDNKDNILKMMKTMRDLDDSGHLWHKWDFDADERLQQQRLAAHMHSIKRTFTATV